MAGPGDLYDACVELLEACDAALAAAPAGRVPRVYVSPGPPVWDGEQLTVHAGGPVVADTVPLQPPLAPGHRLTTQGAVYLVALTVTVLRAVPVAGETRQVLPTAEKVQAAAEKTLGDLWGIWNHLANRKRAGDLFAARDGYAASREMVLDPAVPVNTSGGLAGWQIGIRVQLDGYREA